MSEDTKVCAKCDTPRVLTAYYRRGRGLHRWCKLCCDAATKAARRRKGAKPKRKAPWLNPDSVEASPHKDLILSYEDACGKVALFHMLSMVERDTEKKKARWAAYYRSVERRTEVRTELLKLLAS